MAGLTTGTEVDNSLFRTSRTCLELTAIGNSTGTSVRQNGNCSDLAHQICYECINEINDCFPHHS